MARQRKSQASETRDVARVAVVITPCAEEAALRAALIGVAERCGYTWRDETGLIGDYASSLERRVVLLCSDASLLRGVPLTQSVVIAGPINDAGRAAATRHGWSEREGLIHATRCLAFASEFVEKGVNVSIFSSDRLASDAAKGFQAVVEALGLSPDAIDQLQLLDLFSSRQFVRVRGAPVEPVLSLFRGGLSNPSGPAWWPRSLFWSDRADATCPEIIDITGRSRVLFFGPYITLPAGHWQINVRFAVCKEAARRRYLFEVIANDATVAHAHLWPSDTGNYAIPLDFVAKRPAVVEIRMTLITASLHGEIRLAGAEITRMAVSSPSEERTIVRDLGLPVS